MKISNVNSNIAEFFIKNGKKWACTAVTALMLSTPAIAKTEKKKDDVKPSTTIEQTMNSEFIENDEVINLDVITGDLTGDFSSDINACDKLSKVIDKGLLESIINGMPLKMTTPWKLENSEKNEYSRSIISFRFKTNASDLLVDNYENIVKCIKENSITDKLIESFVEILDVTEEKKSINNEIVKENDNQVVNLVVGDKRLQLRCSADIISFGAIMIIVIVFLFINKIITGRFFK